MYYIYILYIFSYFYIDDRYTCNILITAASTNTQATPDVSFHRPGPHLCRDLPSPGRLGGEAQRQRRGARPVTVFEESSGQDKLSSIRSNMAYHNHGRIDLLQLH